MPSSPNGPWSTGNATSQPSSPPAGAQLDLLAARESSARRARSGPRRPRGRRPRSPRGDRGAGAQRDLVLAEERPPLSHRDPHQGVDGVVVRGRRRRGGGRAVVVGRLLEDADEDRDRVAGVGARARRAGACSSTRPSWRSVGGRLLDHVERPRPSRWRSQRAWSCRARRRRSGDHAEPAPFETTIVTVSPLHARSARSAALVDHLALGLGRARCCVDVRDQPRARELRRRRRPARPTTEGT